MGSIAGVVSETSQLMPGRLSLEQIALSPQGSHHHRQRFLRRRALSLAVPELVGAFGIGYGLTDESILGTIAACLGTAGMAFYIQGVHDLARTWRSYHRELRHDHGPDSRFSYLDGKIVRGHTAVDRRYGKFITVVERLPKLYDVRDAMPTIIPELFFVENVVVTSQAGGRGEAESVGDLVHHYKASFVLTRGDEKYFAGYNYNEELRLPERSAELLQTRSPVSLLLAHPKLKPSESAPFDVVKIYQ